MNALATAKNSVPAAKKCVLRMEPKRVDPNPMDTFLHSSSSLTPVLFLSDMDGTWLSKNPDNRRQLDEGVVKLKADARDKGIDLEFGFVTARPPARVMSENLPAQADWTITHNGGFIHQGLPQERDAAGVLVDKQPLASWNELNQGSHFDSAKALSEANKLVQTPAFSNLHIETVGQVVGNSAADACPYVTSLCFQDASIQLGQGETAEGFKDEQFHSPDQIENFANQLHERLNMAAVKSEFSPVYPYHGKDYVMFDVAAAPANKGNAVSFLRDTLHATPDHVIVAGDGGNDISMMRDAQGHDDGRRVIVVGANRDLRAQASGLAHAILQDPQQDCSLGVLGALQTHLREIEAELAASKH